MSKLFPSLFIVSLIAYIALATIEEFIPGFVSDYFNPHWLFIVVIVLLVVMLIFEKDKPLVAAEDKKWSWPLIFLAGIATLLLLWLGAHELSAFWRVLVALYGGLIVVGILSVLFKE